MSRYILSPELQRRNLKETNFEGKVKDLIKKLRIKKFQFVILVNGHKVGLETIIKKGDVVVFIPFIQGGY